MTSEALVLTTSDANTYSVIEVVKDFQSALNESGLIIELCD